MNQEADPYRPPTTEVLMTEPNRAILPASKGRRFGTLLVDYAGFFLFSALLGLAIGLIWGEAGIQVIERVPDIVFGCVAIIFYYAFFEGLWARTPGKFLFGTVVVNESGGKPSMGQVFGRTLCRLIPFEAFSFFGERGWHDSIPKTWVVLAKPAAGKD